jgi:hypothetical protein
MLNESQISLSLPQSGRLVALGAISRRVQRGYLGTIGLSSSSSDLRVALEWIAKKFAPEAIQAQVNSPECKAWITAYMEDRKGVRTDGP